MASFSWRILSFKGRAIEDGFLEHLCLAWHHSSYGQLGWPRNRSRPNQQPARPNVMIREDLGDKEGAP